MIIFSEASFISLRLQTSITLQSLITLYSLESTIQYLLAWSSSRREEADEKTGGSSEEFSVTGEKGMTRREQTRRELKDVYRVRRRVFFL